MLSACVVPRESTVSEKTSSMASLVQDTIQGVPISEYCNQRSCDLYIDLPKPIIGINWAKQGSGKLKFDKSEPLKFNFTMGSAAAISDNGIFLTAYHNVKEAKSIWVVSRSEEYPYFNRAEVVWFDKSLDLAALKSSVLTPDYFLPRKESPKVDSTVISGGLKGGLSAGLIVKVELDSGGVPEIKHDSPLKRGDSGGPLIDSEGYLIGINHTIESNFMNTRHVASFATGINPSFLQSILKQTKSAGKEDPKGSYQ